MSQIHGKKNGNFVEKLTFALGSLVANAIGNPTGCSHSTRLSQQQIFADDITSELFK